MAKGKRGSFMLNSVIVTALAILLLIVISLPAAYVLARFKFRSSKFWNVLFMAGLFINVNYIVVPIFLMLGDADTYLRQTIGKPFFLNNLFVLALVYAATALPFTIYLLSGYFKSLAKDCGGSLCGRRRLFYSDDGAGDPSDGKAEHRYSHSV